MHNYHVHYLPLSHIICLNVYLILPLKLLQKYCPVCQSVIIFYYFSLTYTYRNIWKLALLIFMNFLAGVGGEIMTLLYVHVFKMGMWICFE